MWDIKHKPEIKRKNRGETEVYPIKHQTNIFQELIIKIQWAEIIGNVEISIELLIMLKVPSASSR